MVATVVIAEDHPIVRMGIRRTLESLNGIHVVGETDNGEGALALVKELIPHVLLLDLEMPGMGGVEVLQQLQSLPSPPRVLILSAHEDRMIVEEVFSLGANGYLLKDDALEEIGEATLGVARGENGWVSRQVAADLASISAGDTQRSKELTRRERQVLKHVADGLTNSQIGAELGISPKTVEKHLYNIYSKMNVSSRVEAAVEAVQAEMIS